MVDTFQASISRSFFISFSSEYYPKKMAKWSPKSMQNPSKNLTFALGHHFGRCWHVLASIWYPFGALWVTFDDLFLPFDGIIERLTGLGLFWHIRSAFFIILYGLNLGTIFPSKLLNIPSNGFVFLESSVVCHRSAKQPTTNNRQPIAFNQQAANKQPTTNN